MSEIHVQELDFDEVITCDYNDMPIDETLGAQERDQTLTEVLYMDQIEDSLEDFIDVFSTMGDI